MRPTFLRTTLVGVVLIFLARPGAGAPAPLWGSVPLHLSAEAPAFEPAGRAGEVVPRVRGFGLSSRPGEPKLPLKILLVAIPEGTLPELKILSARSEPLGSLEVAPVPRHPAADRVARGHGAPGAPDGFEEEFTPDPAIYDRDAEFPDTPIRLGAIGYLREQRFVEVLYTPLLYDPHRRQGRYVPEVLAEVRFNLAEGVEAAAAGGSFRADGPFEEVYRRSLVNYEQGKLFRAPGRRAVATVSPETATASTFQATAGAPRYKILVSRAGIYRLDYATLGTAAPDLLLVNPQTLMLTAEGVEVPIAIRNAAGGSGESDGQFGTGDFLEFYGRPKTEPPAVLNVHYGSALTDIYEANDFTDTQVYWLTSAGAPGSHLRIPQTSGAPVNASFPVATDFEDAVVWDQNDFYWPLLNTDPFFSTPSLLAGGTQAQRDLQQPLPGLVASSATARMTIRLRGGSSLTTTPDHRTQVWINADSAGGTDFTWDGEVMDETQFAVPQSDLSDPTTIHVRLPGLSGVSVDRQYIDRVSISYRRSFMATADQLTFSYPNQDVRFQVGGFSGIPPTIYEISGTVPGSGQAAPVRILDAAVGGSPTSTYTFDVARDASGTAPATRTFIAAGPGGTLVPDAVRRAADPVLRDPQNAADIVVIAARDTVDTRTGGALDRLLTHRLTAQGLTSKVVFVDQIYDEFSFGLRDVNALRSFLSYAFDNWKGSSGTALPPSFVLLVGDATPDYKNTLGRSDWVDQVPTPIMFQLSSIIPYYSSDNWIASFRGDDQMPDVFLGRISTRSAAESEGVFDKVRLYEESPPPGLWKGRAVLVAGDGNYTGESGTFEGFQNDLKAAYFSASPYAAADPLLYFAEPPWNSTDAAAFKSALIDELQGGAALLTYVGHGAFDVWGLTTFFTTSDASHVANGGFPPFMVNVDCLAGGFHYLLPGGSMGEGMTNNPNGGAIATLAPSGLSDASVADVVYQELFPRLFGPAKERILAVAADDLRAGLLSRGKIVDMQAFTFLGDPATVLATPAPPPPGALAAAAKNGEVDLSWQAPAIPVAGYRIYRSAGIPAGPYGAVTCDPVTPTSCVDRTVLNATTYYYRAVSLDAEGFEGRVSNFNGDCDAGPDCVVARPLNPGPPSVPTGLNAIDPGSGGRLAVGWNRNPENDVKTYSLSYGTGPGQYTTKIGLSASVTSTTLTGLTDGTRYYMSLSATNTSGHESAPSAEISQVPHLIQGIAPPRAITDLRVTRSGSDLVLDWSRPTLDIYGRPTTVVGYRVFRGTSPTFQPFVSGPIASIGSGSTTTFTDVGAVAQPANFYYLVTAVDASGFESGAGHDLPNGIQDLRVSSVQPGTVTLTWSASATDVQGFPTILDHYQVHLMTRPLGRESLGPATLFMDNVRQLSVDLPVPSGPVYFSVLVVDGTGNLSPF
jgi:hypothetical protein